MMLTKLMENLETFIILEELLNPGTKMLLGVNKEGEHLREVHKNATCFSSSIHS